MDILKEIYWFFRLPCFLSCHGLQQRVRIYLNLIELWLWRKVKAIWYWDHDSTSMIRVPITEEMSQIPCKLVCWLHINIEQYESAVDIMAIASLIGNIFLSIKRLHGTFLITRVVNCFIVGVKLRCRKFIIVKLHRFVWWAIGLTGLKSVCTLPSRKQWRKLSRELHEQCSLNFAYSTLLSSQQLTNMHEI